MEKVLDNVSLGPKDFWEQLVVRGQYSWIDARVDSASEVGTEYRFTVSASGKVSCKIKGADKADILSLDGFIESFKEARFCVIGESEAWTASRFLKMKDVPARKMVAKKKARKPRGARKLT